MFAATEPGALYPVLDISHYERESGPTFLKNWEVCPLGNSTRILTVVTHLLTSKLVTERTLQLGGNSNTFVNPGVLYTIKLEEADSQFNLVGELLSYWL